MGTIIALRVRTNRAEQLLRPRVDLRPTGAHSWRRRSSERRLSDPTRLSTRNNLPRPSLWRPHLQQRCHRHRHDARRSGHVPRLHAIHCDPSATLQLQRLGLPRARRIPILFTRRVLPLQRRRQIQLTSTLHPLPPQLRLPLHLCPILTAGAHSLTTMTLLDWSSPSPRLNSSEPTEQQRLSLLPHRLPEHSHHCRRLSIALHSKSFPTPLVRPRRRGSWRLSFPFSGTQRHQRLLSHARRHSSRHPIRPIRMLRRHRLRSAFASLVEARRAHRPPAPRRTTQHSQRMPRCRSRSRLPIDGLCLRRMTTDVRADNFIRLQLPAARASVSS